jgi:hypothetical protein
MQWNAGKGFLRSVMSTWTPVGMEKERNIKNEPTKKTLRFDEED